MYGDPERPDRVTRTISGPPYTHEDHALLAALKAYDANLCPGCKVPVSEAWHSDMEGWYEPGGYVCHSCTARAGHEVAYQHSHDTRDHAARPLPPFVLGVTTTKPEPPKKPS